MMILLGIMLLALGKTLEEYAEVRNFANTPIELVGLLGLVIFAIGAGVVFIQVIDLFVVIRQWSYNV